MNKRLFVFTQDRQALLEKMLKESSTDTAPVHIIPRREDHRTVPLSFAQQRLWFLDQLMPKNPVYNLSLAMRYKTLLNVAVLEKSINEIVRRHESLRTTFIKQGDQPVQQIAPNLTISLPIIDLRKLSLAEREAEAVRLSTEEARRSFDLARGPLLRTTLLRLGEADFVFLLTMHHIVSDGWSLQVFAREFSALYSAFTAGKPSPLAELPIQYPDFALWQRESLQGEVLDRQLDYWKRQLADLPVLQLPTDRPRPPVAYFHGDQHNTELSPKLLAGLKRLSTQSGATLFMVLLAAFTVLLHRYSSQDDILVGIPIAGRNRPELENLIGFFVNTLVLRADISGNPTFRELLKQVREATLADFANAEVPFEKLVEELQPARDLSRNPLCQVAFQLFNASNEGQQVGASSADSLPIKRGTAVFDLVLSMWEDGERLAGYYEFNTDLFDTATISRMSGHYQTLLESIVADPDSRLSRLGLLTEHEWQQCIETWNDTAAPFTQDTCIHNLVESQALKRPNAPAVIFEGEVLTYKELNQRANQLAHYLQSLGVGPDMLVGISLPRSHEMVVGLLGVLKAGGAFVPLDPTYPRDRLAFMMADAQVSVLLTQQSLTNQLPEYDSATVCLDRDWDVIARHNDENPLSNVTARNLAYVIYTSGSTGQPKGVQVEHQGLINVARSQTDIFGLDAGYRVLQFSSLNFDASIFEMMMAFYNGSALCLGTREALLPGPALIQLLRENRVSIVTLPPSVLALLPHQPLPDLRTVTVAGEACPADLVAGWAPGRRFFNLYGPTEDTIWTTFMECTSADRKPPIGRPVANTQVYVLDRHLNPTPVGVPGELYISGVGLARGYLQRPSMTAEKFLPNPFSSQPGERMYRTGDLVRYLPEGELDFLGRIDQQVKLRGFRIELGEIEAALNQYAGVRESLVVLQEDERGEKRLVAYVLADQDTDLSSEKLRRFLRQQLPEYMIPSAVMILAAWPLSPNGKLDHRALPKPESVFQPRRATFVPPRTSLQRTIAEVWQALLPVKEVGMHDNFFDLGGHSLLLAQVHSRLRELLPGEVSMLDLFRFPTVGSLAQYLSAEQAAPSSLEHVHDRALKQQQAIRQRRERMKARMGRSARDGQG